MIFLVIELIGSIIKQTIAADYANVAVVKTPCFCAHKKTPRIKRGVFIKPRLFAREEWPYHWDNNK